MKKKALIKVLAAPEDLDRLQGVLDHLRSNGIVISGAQGSLGKKDIVLAVLSEQLYSDEALKAQLFDQLAVGAETILPLNLADTPVPEEIMNLLFARNIIMASDRSDEQLAERILSAIPEKKNHMTAVFAAAVAVLFLLGGIFLWQSLGQQEAEPAIAAEEPVPNPLGITEEELAEIRKVVIIGDYFGYFTYADFDSTGHWPEIGDFAYEVVDDNESHWYSTEDGHEFTLTRYDDLRFLELMPNLNTVSMVLVDVDAAMLPDLSGSKRLTTVSIHNCSMTDIGWIAGSPVSFLNVFETNIEDYGPLSDCTSLIEATIDGRGKHQGDFSEFAPPAITTLRLQNMDAEQELSALTKCPKLEFLRLDSLQIRNLDFVKQLQKLKYLELNNLPQLQNISGIAELPDLRELSIWQCDSVRDYMPINACRTLEAIHIDRWNWMYADSAFLNGLTRLRSIGLFGLNLNNMDFLAEVNQTYGMNLGFCGEIQDYSGLAHIKSFQWLHVNPRSTGSRFGDYALVEPYLQDASIGDLELYNCTNVDLTKLPNLTGTLRLTGGDLEELTGLDNAHVQQLELKDMQYLRSLKGVEALPNLPKGVVELSLMGCIRMTDYSALDGVSLRTLKLCGMYSLPDFSKFSLKSLRLESIEDMEDLRCLETLSKDTTYHFEFLGLEDLKDLSILRNFKGNNLFVPPQVADQAAELVENGNFGYYEVRYPDSGWTPMNEEVVLLSLEELDTLPKAILRRVSTVWIAGDQIIDPNRYEVWDEWHNNRSVSVLYDRETGKTSRIDTGDIYDFSRLAELTNLRELRLFAQPITSLEGIQHLSGLEGFEAMDCINLQDVSALYALQNLDNITFQITPVDSIQGVQNLPRLRHLSVYNTHVTDLSALKDFDFSHTETVGGFVLNIGGTAIEDLSPLAEIPALQHLNICGYPPENWMHYVENTYIRTFCGPMGSDELLRQFVQQHPELEEMHIENGYELTDLTALLELENLTYVHVWNNAQGAGRSLKDAQLHFQLDID